MNNPPKILVADDVPTNIQLLSRLLQKNGYDVKTANNGVEVFNSIKSDKPDLILLDIIMPDIDGYEICNKIKSNTEMSDTPIIFFTAKTETDDIIKGLEVGGSDYITKPFKAAEVLARVNTHIKIKTMHEQSLLYQKEILISQKMASITTLAGGIAHNINNLMGAVVGYTDMLRISLNGHEKAKDYTEKILDASQRVTELTRDLLTYSRSIRNEPTNVKVKELIETLLLLYNDEKNKKLNIDIDIPKDIPNIYVDPNQVCRALANIFINAQEASPDGGTIKISAKTDKIPSNLSKTKSDEYIVISISDNGPGIDRAIADRIFEPFFTYKQNVGSGLGLSAASGIIQKNKGFINLDTTLGKGATFHIYLPKITGIRDKE